MIDIQSPTAEIRRGKQGKKERRKKPQCKNIMTCPIPQGGHNNGLRRNCASQMFGNRPPPAPTGRAQEECY